MLKKIKMGPAKLPLDKKKTSDAFEDGLLIYKMMKTCNQRIEKNQLENNEKMIRSLFEYCILLKNPFLIYPNLRKDYRNFVFEIVNLYPSVKELGLKSVYRIFDFKNDYYYIK